MLFHLLNDRYGEQQAIQKANTESSPPTISRHGCIRNYPTLLYPPTQSSFLYAFADLGLAQAVIQRPSLTHRELSGLFWMNVAVSLGLAALMVLAAPLVAAARGDCTWSSWARRTTDGGHGRAQPCSARCCRTATRTRPTNR